MYADSSEDSALLSTRSILRLVMGIILVCSSIIWSRLAVVFHTDKPFLCLAPTLWSQTSAKPRNMSFLCALVSFLLGILLIVGAFWDFDQSDSSLDLSGPHGILIVKAVFGMLFTLSSILSFVLSYVNFTNKSIL